MNTLEVSALYLLLEYIWISTMTPRFYKHVFSTIQKKPLQPNMLFAIIAYVLLLMTIIYICIPLSKTYKYPWLAFGIVGLSIYGIYNCTNKAVFSEYPMDMVIIDTLWGFVCFSIIGLFYSQNKT